MLTGQRVLVATAQDDDPALGAAVVMAGASGLLPRVRTRATLEDALRRALAGELVLPDDHLASLVRQVPLSEAGDPAAAHMGSLTARELEVLRLLANGSTTGEIARLLQISPMTVQSHVKNVLAKLGVHSKVEAVRARLARRHHRDARQRLSASADQARALPLSDMSTDPVRILVVGSHPVILGVVRLACEDIPEVTIVAEEQRGEDALRAVIAMTPDLVVLDLDLPDVPGTEVLRALRDGGYDGAVVALSERADGAAVLESMRLGVDGYLSKPEGLRRVGDAIRLVLAGERAVEPALEQAAVLELGRFARQAREGSEVGSALTPREREILELLAEGLTMQQIGRRLGISARTVETHVAKLYRKLSVRTRVQAVARAASLGLIELR